MFRNASRATAAITVLIAVVAITTPVSAAADSHPAIVPHEFFMATVNGSTGDGGPVTISMACGGPSTTGHPVGGQTLGVKLVPVPSSATSVLGYTGDSGTSIGAFFGAPPPGGGAASYVSFAVYRTKPMPTSLVLPCSGFGRVTFVPLPNLPPARSITVPVEFSSPAM
jgi:hypothetical protein